MVDTGKNSNFINCVSSILFIHLQNTDYFKSIKFVVCDTFSLKNFTVRSISYFLYDFKMLQCCILERHSASLVSSIQRFIRSITQTSIATTLFRLFQSFCWTLQMYFVILIQSNFLIKRSLERGALFDYLLFITLSRNRLLLAGLKVMRLHLLLNNKHTANQVFK